ncbi:MAG: DUF4013 domain-containing protein [Acidobacteriota bacterium]
MGRSVSYPFRGPGWLPRVLVGAALEVAPLLAAFPVLRAVFRSSHHLRPGVFAWLPVVALVGLSCRFVVLGYMRRIARDVLQGNAHALPAWDRFGEDLTEGVKLWLLMLALWLPGAGLVLAAVLLVGLVAWPAAAWVPALVFGPPVALVTLLYLPAGVLTAIETDELGRAFDLQRVSARIGRVFGPYLLVFVFAVAAEIFAQTGLILVCVGIFATRFIAHVMTVHAFATVIAADRFATPPPASPNQASPVAGAISLP